MTKRYLCLMKNNHFVNTDWQVISASCYGLKWPWKNPSSLHAWCSPVVVQDQREGDWQLECALNNSPFLSCSSCPHSNSRVNDSLLSSWATRGATHIHLEHGHQGSICLLSTLRKSVGEARRMENDVSHIKVHITMEKNCMLYWGEHWPHISPLGW